MKMLSKAALLASLVCAGYVFYGMFLYFFVMPHTLKTGQYLADTYLQYAWYFMGFALLWAIFAGISYAREKSKQ